MVFFAYSGLFTNNAFMKGHKLNSTISSMIIAPSIGVIAFSLFFIIYAQTCFTKYRKPDFGLFMTLGMTNRDIAKIIVIENSLIGGAALITGIPFGMIFFKLLSFVISKIIALNGIILELSYKSFLYTILFFTVIFILSIMINLLASRKYEILTLLKETKHKDNNRFHNGFFAALSIVLFLIAIIDGVVNVNVDNEVAMYRSILLCLLGSYFFITNIGLILNKYLRKTKKHYYKNLIFLTNLEYNLGQAKKIMFAVLILVNITIFFGNLPIVFLHGAEGVALYNNPYDIAYSEFMGRNKISKEKLQDILKNPQTDLIFQESVSLIDYRRIFLFSDRELNQKLNTDFNVKSGNFINLFVENFDDGYRHTLDDIRALTIETEEISFSLKSQGRYVGVIFNPILAANKYLVLNQNDYNNIRKRINENYLGELNLFNFKDWKKTEKALNNLTTELFKYNESLQGTCFENRDIDQFILKPASKIGLYNETLMGGRALLLYHSFISILFFMAVGIMLHFKLMTELEREKKKYKKLFKIGITDWEIKRIVSKELAVLFFIPQALAIIIAIIYSYIMPIYQRGERLMGVLYALIIGLLYLVFQYIFFNIYKKHYIKSFY